MTKVDKLGKGIILMHDFQKHTAEALPTLLRRLKAGGYKVVQIKAKAPVQTLAEYDEAMVKDDEAAGRQRTARQQRGADGYGVAVEQRTAAFAASGTITTRLSVTCQGLRASAAYCAPSGSQPRPLSIGRSRESARGKNRLY